ncbi:DUF3558 domain-containing protein [Streptomyces sp. NPDC005551]|uniref:DUF3558 domain-containing protein n=1 Tax=unclassified Streptomyces TaxID=2593676 RepID=UPI0033CA5422
MHRTAQRAPRDQRVLRLPRILVCAAAVPVMLVAAGCSSDSGSGDDAKQSAGQSAKPSASASADAIEPAAYAKLPEPCSVVSKKTLGDLVPEAGKSGREGKSDDLSVRGNCYWDSLDSNGVKGSQYRWLNVAMLRFDSDARGEGDKLAHDYYEKQVAGAQAVSGAKNTKSEPVSGTGDEATAVRYELKKKEGSFRQQTVVTRVENVVITLDYNGAGLAGDKAPDAAGLVKDAQKAAKEAVAAVAAANGDGDGASAAPSKSASKSASKSPSKPASKSPSKSASKTPGESASKSPAPSRSVSKAAARKA